MSRPTTSIARLRSCYRSRLPLVRCRNAVIPVFIVHTTGAPLLQCSLACFDATVAPYPEPVVQAAMSLIAAGCLMSPATQIALICSPAFQHLLSNCTRILSPLPLDCQVSGLATVLTLMFMPLQGKVGAAPPNTPVTPVPSTSLVDLFQPLEAVLSGPVTALPSDTERGDMARSCIAPYVNAIVDPASAPTVHQHVCNLLFANITVDDVSVIPLLS